MTSPPDTPNARELDSFEEFFFYMEQIAPTLHIHAIHLKGPTSFEQWHRTWQELHDTNPLLYMRINKESGRRPRFIQTRRLSPLEIEEWTNDFTLEMLAEDAFSRPFGNGNQDMVRVTVRHRPEEALVVLASHHSLYDGMGTLLLLQDFLTRLSGEARTADPARSWISLREAVGAPKARDGYHTVLQTQVIADDKLSSSKDIPTWKTQVRHIVFDKSLTLRLEESARANGTTPHGALMAAFQLAGARTTPAWADGINCNSAHSVRPTLPDGAAMTGMLTMPIITRLESVAGRSFWEIAATAHRAMAPARTAEGRLAFVAAMDAMTRPEQTPSEFLEQIVRSPIQYPLMITNYASYRPVSTFGDLRIASLMTGVDGGGPYTQTIGACSINGELHLTLISKNPLERLLEGARDILVEAME